MYFANEDITLSPPYTDYTTAAQTICFDITNATPPRITLWATGKNGADCADSAKLTAATAIFNKSDWTTTVALENKNVYVYKATTAAATKVTAYVTTFGTGF